MSDLRLDDVVETSGLIGPQGRRFVGICKTCSERYSVVRGDFTHPTLKRLDSDEDGIKFKEFVPSGVDDDFLEYIATMRAWACCHGSDEPLDGFPDEPDTPIGFKLEDL